MASVSRRIVRNTLRAEGVMYPRLRGATRDVRAEYRREQRAQQRAHAVEKEMGR